MASEKGAGGAAAGGASAASVASASDGPGAAGGPGVPESGAAAGYASTAAPPGIGGALTRTLLAFDRPERGLGGPELIALACLVDIMGVVEWLQAQTPGLVQRMWPVSPAAPAAWPQGPSLGGGGSGGGDAAGVGPGPGAGAGVGASAEQALAPLGRSLGGVDANRLAGILSMLGLGDGGSGGAGGGSAGKEDGAGDKLNLASLMPLLSLLLSQQEQKRKEPQQPAAAEAGQGPQPGQMNYQVSERPGGGRRTSGTVSDLRDAYPGANRDEPGRRRPFRD